MATQVTTACIIDGNYPLLRYLLPTVLDLWIEGASIPSTLTTSWKLAKF
jgi:hypothetical protein